MANDVQTLAAELAKKFVGKEGLAAIKEQLDTKVKKETGKGLSEKNYTEAEQTKLGGVETGAQVNVIESVEFNGTQATVSGKKATITADVLTSKSLEDYETKDTAEGKYQSKSDMNNYYDKSEIDEGFVTTEALEEIAEQLGSIGEYKGPTTLAGEATLKTTLNPGDYVTVTDDNNHVHIFVGADKAGSNGINENGFLDVGGHVPADLVTLTDLNSKGYLTESKAGETYQSKNDMSNYYNKTEAESKFIDQSELESALGDLETVEELSKEEVLAILLGTAE